MVKIGSFPVHLWMKPGLTRMLLRDPGKGIAQIGTRQNENQAWLGNIIRRQNTHDD